MTDEQKEKLPSYMLPNLRDSALEAARDQQWQDMLAQQEPIGFISAKQVPAIQDPDDESGRYMPMRKTPAGNFTLALYAAPVVQQADPCPGCQRGGVCKTPECGRLKLPTNHPLRTGDHFPDAGKMMQQWSDAKQAELNDWFLSLPEGRRHMLAPDKWALAGAAFEAGKHAAAPDAPAPQPLTCERSIEDDDSGTWRSSCGELWSFFDGGPKENRVTYCPHCGGKVVIGKGGA